MSLGSPKYMPDITLKSYKIFFNNEFLLLLFLFLRNLNRRLVQEEYSMIIL